MIFVFGSNLAGRHGAGAAQYAFEKFGAEIGAREGMTGKCYAIPTKDERIRTLKISEIEKYVKNFIVFAKYNDDMEFFLTDIGCGLAGYSPEKIAPLFVKAPKNVHFSKNFYDILKEITPDVERKMYTKWM